MRVAALYDIHGNLPALEAVMEDVRRSGVEQIVVGGDVVPGPMPRESLELLLGLDIPVQFIHGNGDREVLAHLRGQEMTTVPEQFREPLRWSAAQLLPGHEAELASWPAMTSLEVEGIGEVAFCHATPRNDVEIFTRLTPEARLVPVFEELYVPLVVCGHTHMQFNRIVGATRVVNAGSVGMPFGAPGAYWLLLGSGVEFRRTDYDLESAAARVRTTAYPAAADFAEASVLRPPSEEAILERFSKAQLS
jgi:predicted phosphodiesterase